MSFCAALNSKEMDRIITIMRDMHLTPTEKQRCCQVHYVWHACGIDLLHPGVCNASANSSLNAFVIRPHCLPRHPLPSQLADCPVTGCESTQEIRSNVRKDQTPATAAKLSSAASEAVGSWPDGVRSITEPMDNSNSDVDFLPTNLPVDSRERVTRRKGGCETDRQREAKKDRKGCFGMGGMLSAQR